MNRFYLTRYYLSLIAILLQSAVSAQDYYRQDSVQEVKIYFAYTNWDYRLDTAKAGKEDYILASYCLINGVRYDSVGVKYKGNSSYRAAQVKNPLHIKLDWVRESQNYNKITSMKFGNNFADPSAVREVMCYEILGHYMDCSVANFAKVYVNDQYLGLYSNVEAVNKNSAVITLVHLNMYLSKAIRTDRVRIRPAIWYTSIMIVASITHSMEWKTELGGTN